MEKIEKHTAEPQAQPVRLSDYVPGIFLSISSKKGMKKAIEKGLVKVNGQVAHTSNYINGGETIELYKREAESNLPEITLDIEVLYEDDHIAIVNKPAGIVVSGNKEKTLANALPSSLKASAEPSALDRPQPAHRLDYPTSGVLLIGKTSNVLTALNKLFENKKVEKTYHAITIGKVEKGGEIKNELKGKKAETSYEVIDTIASPKFKFLSYLKLTPKTGRRHQLRIHMADLGHPILGDHEYGLDKRMSTGNGLYLHASEISFAHPITEEAITVAAALPKKFERILANPISEKA